MIKLISHCHIFHFIQFCRIHLFIGIKGTIKRIEGDLTLYEDLVHKVLVLEVYYDSSEAIQVGTTIDITTGSHTCGFHDLSEAVTYLMSAGIDPDIAPSYVK